MAELGIKSVDIVNRTGLTKGTVSQWVNGQGKPKAGNIVKLARVLRCTPEWLMFGATANAPAPAAEESVSEGPETRGLVPVISWVMAGTWHEAEEHTISADTEFLPCPVTHGWRTYALRVVGDSMTSPSGRSYPDGMIIYVDPDQTADAGDRVIAKLSGHHGAAYDVTFKQLALDGSRYYLRPLNPNHPPIFDQFAVIGKVIGAFIKD